MVVCRILYSARYVQTKLCLICIYMSESDILDPHGNLSDIKNLVSFERELFENSSYKYKIKKSYYLCQDHNFEI